MWRCVYSLRFLVVEVGRAPAGQKLPDGSYEV
jgi:hypothetical protein